MQKKISELHNLTHPLNSAIQVKWCDSFLTKLKGFTFRKSLTFTEGLVLVEKRNSRIETSIHMLFVWTNLAVIWVNTEFQVVDTVLAKSWQPVYISSKPACYTIEIHPDRLSEFHIGDIIHFEHKNH